MTTEYVGIFMRNYKTAPGSNTEIRLQWSDTGTSGPWTTWSSVTNTLLALRDTDEPIHLQHTASSIAHRYWRFQIVSADIVVEVAQWYLHRRRQITVGNIFPEPDASEYGTRIVHLAGGRTLKTPVNRVPVWDRVRTWLIEGETDMTSLQAAWDDTRGRHCGPAVIQGCAHDAHVDALETEPPKAPHGARKQRDRGDEDRQACGG